MADFTIVKEVELVGLWTADSNGKPSVVLSFRLDSGSFAVTNLSLSAEQARRLLIDLTQRFEHSALLQSQGEPDPELRIAFDRIISQQPFSPKVKPDHDQ